jgi:hypothetical protein
MHLHRTHSKLAISALLCAVLAGCTGLEGLRQAPPQPSQVIVERSIENISTVERALLPFAPGPTRSVDGPTSLEVTQLRDIFVRTNSEDSRLALATALALNPNSDERELSQLLEPLLQGDNGKAASPSAASVRSYALILDSLANDRKVLRDLRTQMATKVKEVQVVTQQVQRNTEHLAARQKAEQRADELQAKVDQLQKKLDALLAIEKSIASKTPNGKPR